MSKHTDIASQIISLLGATKLEMKINETQSNVERLRLIRRWKGGKVVDWKMSPLELSIEEAPDGTKKGVWLAKFATSGVFVPQGQGG